MFGNTKIKDFKEKLISNPAGAYRQKVQLGEYIGKYIEDHRVGICENNYDDHLTTLKRVFFFSQSIRGYRNSTFFLMMADIFRPYLEDGYEVIHVMSGFIEEQYIFLSDRSSVSAKKQIISALSDVYGFNPEKYTPVILGDLSSHDLSVDSYLENALLILKNLKITKNDFIICAAGPSFDCAFLKQILKRTPARVFLQQLRGDQSLENYIDIADYIMTTNSDQYQSQFSTKFSLERILNSKIRMDVSHWERIETPVFSIEELEATKLCDNANLVIVCAGTGLQERFDKEYIEFLKEINSRFDSVFFIFVGASKDELQNILPLNENSYAAVKFSVFLYSFFVEIKKKNNKCFYVYPKHSGSGRTNSLAGIAGFIPFLIKGNDSQIRLPEECFYANYSDALQGMADSMSLERFDNMEIINYIKEKNQISHAFFLNLSDSKTYSRQR